MSVESPPAGRIEDRDLYKLRETLEDREQTGNVGLKLSTVRYTYQRWGLGGLREREPTKEGNGQKRGQRKLC